MARLSHWKQPASTVDNHETAADADPSMTFQIPFEGHETRLLDMGDDNFLDGLNDSFGSPQRTTQLPSIAQPPLTLEELTPRKRLKHGLQDALATNIYAESTPFFKREQFSPIRRLRVVEDEENVEPHDSAETKAVELAHNHAAAPSPKRISHVLPARGTKQELAMGGNVASARLSERLSSTEETCLSVHPPPVKSARIVSRANTPDSQRKPDTGDSANGIGMSSRPEPSRRSEDAKEPSSSNVGGAKAKGQKALPINATRSKRVATAPVLTTRPAPTSVRQAVTRPITAKTQTSRTTVKESRPLLTKETVPATREQPTYSADKRLQTTRPSSPLTLSQLSPSKQIPDVVSPMEPSTHSSPPTELATYLDKLELQRQDSLAPPTVPQRSSSAGQPSAGRAPDVTVPAPAPYTVVAPRTNSSKAKPTTKAFAGNSQAKKQQPRRRSSVQRNYCVPSVTSKQKSAPQPSALARKRRAVLLDREQSDNSSQRRVRTLGSSADRSKPSADRLTKPVEFRFQVDSRLSARKHEKAPDSATCPAPRPPRDPSIPDFAALHAAEAERIHMRKEQITPTIPQPLDFTVDARLREREKYEEGRRAREAEIEQTREDARLEREREEEAEICRLRKLAVPKANAVPEWYAHAPKKSSLSASTSSLGPA